MDSEKPDPMLFENLEQLLTYEQISMWLGLSVSTLEKYVHRREIPVVKFNKRTVRFRTSDIKKWLQSKNIGEKNGT